LVSDQVLIRPERLPGDPRLGPLGLLVVNPGEAEIAARLSGNLQWQRHFLFNSRMFADQAAEQARISFWAGPAVGAPMASMVLEKLIILGAKKVVVFGWCGSLDPALPMGTLLLPTWAVSEEGTSGHYPTQGRPESGTLLRRSVHDYLAPRERVLEGPVWTTDAPYRETREKVRRFREQGVVAVEMEFSALCSVAAYRGVEIAGVMLVSDELWREEWQSGFRNKSFRKRNREILEMLFRYETGEGRSP
jgi:uridine phosphorylase